MSAFLRGFIRGISTYDHWPRWALGLWCAAIGFVWGWLAHG